MKNLANLDLLSVGIMVVVTCVLGFTVYFNNRKSITNKIFLALTLDTAVWIVVNYFAYQFSDIHVATLLIRFVLFFATFQGVFLYELFLVFPKEKYVFSNKNKFIFIPIGVVVSVLTLTPYVFYGILDTEVLGASIRFSRGSLWFLFALFSAGSILVAIFTLLRKIHKSDPVDKKALILIFIGLTITYTLILTFNLTLPMFFNTTKYIILGPLFTFPFLACIAYAILKHKLFDLKVTETILFSIGLLVITFISVVFSGNVAEVIFRGGIFILILVFTIIFLRLIIREIKQRKEIQDLNIRLKELDELKSQFFSLARHNIANPLTALKGYLSLFQEEMSEDSSASAEKTKRLGDMERVTDNLITIIRDFLDVSRAEEGKIQYNFSNTNPKEVLEEVLEKNKTKIEQKNIKLIYNFDADKNYVVRADKEKLFQAISNIIENSIKYTKDGQINIKLSSENSKLVLEISDTGVRNLPSTPSKLLEKFSPSGNKEEADIITSGLGLYFTRQIIKAHGGDFRIICIKDGQGSRFCVELPIQ